MASSKLSATARIVRRRRKLDHDLYRALRGSAGPGREESGGEIRDRILRGSASNGSFDARSQLGAAIPRRRRSHKPFVWVMYRLMPIEVVLDRRLSITCIRLYGVLRRGHSLSEAAALINGNIEYIKRAERTLIRYGYLEKIVTRRSSGRDDYYNFPES